MFPKYYRTSNKRVPYLDKARHRLRKIWIHHVACINPAPIFVFGNQKSGTSAIAALLGKATGLSYAIDVFCRLDEGLEDRIFSGTASIDVLVAQGRYYFSKGIVKDPGFTFFYEDFRGKFPDAQRVFVLRDPRQNIRSILNRLGLPGNLENLTGTHWQMITERFPGWIPVLEGKTAGHKGGTYIETLALRCKKILDIYYSYHSEVLSIHYEVFNKDKVQSIERLADQLGLKVTHTIDHVKDLQFQPKGQNEASLDVFFGSKNLSKIEEICGPSMIAAGYKI